MGEAEAISWRTFFDLCEKAEKEIRQKIDDFYAETGEVISVVVKRFTEQVESDNYIEKERGRLVMEVILAGNESKAKELISLLNQDLPLKGNNPKKIAEKFLTIFGEATEIIKKELCI